MKKFLLVIVLLPLVSFCYTVDEIRDRVRGVDIYSYDDNFNYKVSTFYGHIDDVVVALKTMTIAVCCSPGYLNYPDIDASAYYSTNSWNSSNITRCVFDVSDKYYRVSTFAELPPIYKFCLALYSNGYRGSGFVSINDSDIYNAKINFNYSLAVADIASSTNLVFQRLLLNHLSIINSSLSSIGSSVGTINTDYQTVNNLSLNPSKQNLLDSVANPSSLNGNSSIAANLDQLFGSSYAGRESEITKALSELARSQLQAAWLSTLDPDSPFYMQNLDNIISDPDTFQKAALQGGGGGGSALANIMRDVKKLSTNDWVSGVTNQLANNRASITNQLAHMFDDTPDSVGHAIRDTSSNAQTISSMASSIDQRLANGITVAVVNQGANSVLVSLDGPINIDQTQFNSLSVPLGSLQNTVSDWYSDWYSFFSVSSPVYKWENFYNMVSSFKDQNHIDLSAVTNSLSSLSSLSNLLAKIDEHLTNSLPNLTNFSIASSSFSALLLDHYEDYISNSVYASSISKLQSDYPSVYSNLVDFGLSPSGDGYFWSLFGSSLIQLDLLADNFISDMALVRKFADDNIQGGFSAGISSIVEVMPKKEDIVSAASSASNVVSALDLSSTNLVSAFHSVTSRADSVFSPFRGSFETPPSDLVLFKTGNDKYITIPIHEHPEAFRLMRWGFAFALAAVNFIFFPKFVLMLVMLFSKLSQRFVKFYPSVKDE